MENNSTMLQTEHGAGTLVSYFFGFIGSLALTGIVYVLVEAHVHSHHRLFSHPFIMAAAVALGFLQLLVQLFCFLHMGRKSKPRWNWLAFAFMIIFVCIIVGGSLWIMYNLNYNMLTMAPIDMNALMQDQGSW